METHDLHENISQQHAEQAKKLKKEEEVENYSLCIDSLNKEKERIESELEKEKKTNQGQMEQILKLNEDIITAIKEKQQLQGKIQERDAKIEEMRMALDQPDKYVEKVRM